MNSCRYRAGRRLLSSLLVVLTLMGCSSWKPVGAPLEARLSGPDAPESIRVRLVDGTTFDLREVSASADSLRGLRVVAETFDGRKAVQQTTPYVVALSEVRSIEAYKQKTEAFVLLSVLVVVAALAVAVGIGAGQLSK